MKKIIFFFALVALFANYAFAEDDDDEEVIMIVTMQILDTYETVLYSPCFWIPGKGPKNSIKIDLGVVQEILRKVDH